MFEFELLKIGNSKATISFENLQIPPASEGQRKVVGMTEHCYLVKVSDFGIVATGIAAVSFFLLFCKEKM